jgi:hypothetical protein
MVGTGRFELPTPRTPSECSTRLSHVPTTKESAAQKRGDHSGKFGSDYNIGIEQMNGRPVDVEQKCIDQGGQDRTGRKKSYGVSLLNNPTPKWGSYLYKCSPAGLKI